MQCFVKPVCRPINQDNMALILFQQFDRYELRLVFIVSTFSRPLLCELGSTKAEKFCLIGFYVTSSFPK